MRTSSLKRLYTLPPCTDKKIILRLLLEQGANPNAVNQWGHSPAHMAAHGGHRSMLDLLAQSAADLTIRAHNSFSVLMVALSKGDLGTAQHLLTRGLHLQEGNSVESDVMLILRRSPCAEKAVQAFVLNMIPYFEADNYLGDYISPFSRMWFRRILKRLSPQPPPVQPHLHSNLHFPIRICSRTSLLGFDGPD